MKRALVIGINYAGQLHSCLSDASRMNSFCTSRGYQVRLLLETAATKQGILDGMEWLFSSQCSDYLIFYSGHGTGVRDSNQDEADTQDEAIVPFDYKSVGYIMDDHIRRQLDRLPDRTNFIGIFDCCNSGTIADLLFTYTYNAGTYTQPGKYIPNKTVCTISACTDQQTAVDTGVYGLLTQGFLQAMGTRNSITVQQLMDNLGTYTGSKQSPVISFGSFVPMSTVIKF